MMKNFTFRQYKRSPKEDPKDASSGSPKDKESASYLKRREQVRRAQRTHRERKEGYIKSLETEVLQLRTNEAKILQETRTLYTEITRLKKLLDHHGINHASQQTLERSQHVQRLDSSSSGEPSSSSISVVTNPQQKVQLHVHGLGGSGTGSEFYLSESESAPSQAPKAARRKRSFFGSRGNSSSVSKSESYGSGSGSGNGSNNASLQPDLTAISRSPSHLNLGAMDQTSLGMEFVLTLEAPCLTHNLGDPSNPQLPTGHVLTATAPLLFQSQAHHVHISPSTTSTQPWETSSLGLQTLLSLSDNLPLSDEITPVQAWQQIRSHPDYSSVGVPGLRSLTEEMLKNVKCHGFGAVIETEVFAQLLGELFPGTILNFNYWGE